MTTNEGSEQQIFLWDPKKGLTPTDQPIPAESKGAILHNSFVKGSYSLSSISTNDPRFLEPVGFARSELLHEDSFYGYFQSAEKARPKAIRMFIDELMARAAGFEVHSPRGQKDRIATMEWAEFSKPAKAILLYKDGQLLREERGAGDLRPELVASEAQCVADGALYVTTESRRQTQQFTGKGHERQGSLLDAPSLEDDLLLADRAIDGRGPGMSR